ncbi:MAG: tyrosine-type recombinase/integrase [Thiotrichales bacterium]|nr:tyrosine-type recombinase/integrase [Thiotrichales bacterium]
MILNKKISDRNLSSLDIIQINGGVKGERIPISENLYLFVTTKNKKRWEYRYKTLEGKYTFRKLGVIPDLTLSQAIFEVERNNSLLADGLDPFQSANLLQKKVANDGFERKTFQEVYEDYCEFKMAHDWKEQTLHKHNLRFRKHVLPFIGNMYIDEVKVKELTGVLSKIQDLGILNVRDKVANVLKGMYEWAIAKNYDNGKAFTDLNYAKMVPKVLFPAKKSKNFRHVTTSTEYKELVRKVYSIRAVQEVKACLVMGLHLFTRPSEITGLRWEQVDFKNKKIDFSAAQMKKDREFIVPISKQVLKMLKKLKAVSGHSEYVFLSTYRAGDRKPISAGTLTNALKRNGITEASAHGFRHCASTLLRDELGFNDAEIEAQLSHQVGGVKGVYNKAQYMKVRTKMMNKWSKYIKSHLDNK